jgi:DNA-binding transcriptional LysR family regulator
MDLRQIQYFICLYEEKSVTRAAKRLNIVQPALSMQIARLESEIARELFTRTPRGMRSTPAADEMYSLFVPVVSAFAVAKAKVVHDGKGLSGHVRVGLIASICQSVLPQVITQFNEQYPDVTLSITEGLTDPLSNSVSNHHLDLALINRPQGVCNLVQESVLTEEIVVASSARVGNKLPAKLEIEDVLKQKLILPTRDHGLRCLIDDFAKKLGVTMVPAIELDSIMAQALLVSQAPYLAFLPKSIVNNLMNRASIHLRTHRLAAPLLMREVVYVYSPQKVPTAAAQAFAHTLITAIRESNDGVSGSAVDLRRIRSHQPLDPTYSLDRSSFFEPSVSSSESSSEDFLGLILRANNKPTS